MWPSRLFWKLFLSYTGLILATAAVFAALVSAQQKEQVVAHLRDRLHAEAVVLRSHVGQELAAGEHEGLQDLTADLGKQTGTRLTIIADDGTVLADSEQNPAQMERHGDRPEVIEAMAKGEGVRNHISRTLGFPMMYLALRVDNRDGSPVGLVRVALPMHAVEAQVAARQRLVWGIAMVVGLATLAVTYLVVGRITRPVTSLTVAADAIAAGEYGQKVHVPNRDELGSLGAAFNRMSAELASRVSQIRGDRELLATVLGGMVEGVIAVDAKQRILFANESARSMFGMTTANIADRPLWELVRYSAVQEAVEQAFADEQPCRKEFELTGPSRQSLVLFGRRLIGDPPPGAILVLHDVTELRRLENLRREFVANVSHELKTPLASIKAYVETLLGGAVNDPENNLLFLRRIAEQADRLHRLILDLLRLARVESGQEAFEIKAVPLADVVAGRVSELQAAATTKRSTLVTQPSDPPICVRADAEGVRTILDNLLDNAIKYTPDGGRVTIRWRPENSMAVIEVEDSGIGIAPRDQARIFERFYRVDKARSRELGGTGLGLSIVKHLSQAFGGTVVVSSEVGRGSIFTVRLPLA